jgi:hypothetical protein
MAQLPRRQMTGGDLRGESSSTFDGLIDLASSSDSIRSCPALADA